EKEKVDKQICELKVISDYSYKSGRCKKSIQIWLDGEMFFEIETKEIKDHKILEKLVNNSTMVGYLQTPQNEFNLKPNINLNVLNKILIDCYLNFEQINSKLFEEIRNNISLIKNGTDQANIFNLHRLRGEKSCPTKNDVLSLLNDIEKMSKFNPFIIDKKDEFYVKIECYLIQETLIQQLKRVLSLIVKYKSLDLDNDKEERERMLENIIKNILMQRSYKDKENSIYQLNMGEGKTSVILVILSQMLANGKSSARINCLEPLIGVMQELLRNKFSGSLQKKIYVRPFSRGVLFSRENVEKIREMLNDCKNGKHILLVTPGQRLCFQLKKQEMFLEYPQSKDADDSFDWEKHDVGKNGNHTKHYEKKLTGNAHTLAGEGETRGFSGTDDRNDTIPESVIPKRLPSQEGTNGKMLHTLSRTVNKYVIKKRFLEYQKKIKDIPVQSLIIPCISSVSDSIEDLYAKTPQERNSRDILNQIMGAYSNNFYPNLTKELTTLNENHPFDNKGPIKQIPITEEVNWAFDSVFEQNFIEKGLKGEDNYPKLKQLNKCFDYTNIDDFKHLKSEMS
ncbi:unnamed protein product, partial [Didymodactylos carnosus]